MFRSVWDRILYGPDPLCLHRTGSKLERNGSIWDHLHISGAIWYQMADPIRTGSTLFKATSHSTIFGIPFVKIKDTDDVLPVNEGPQLP